MSKTNRIPRYHSSDFVAQHRAQTGKRRAHIKQLEDDICALAAHINAAMFRWLGESMDDSIVVHNLRLRE